MDENKITNKGSDNGIGADNESIFASRREGATTPPAYAQRRAGAVPPSPGVQRQPSQRPTPPQARPAVNGQGAVRRPVPVSPVVPPKQTQQSADNTAVPQRAQGQTPLRRPVPANPNAAVRPADPNATMRPSPANPNGTMRPAPQRVQGQGAVRRPVSAVPENADVATTIRRPAPNEPQTPAAKIPLRRPEVKAAVSPAASAKQGEAKAPIRSPYAPASPVSEAKDDINLMATQVQSTPSAQQGPASVIPAAPVPVGDAAPPIPPLAPIEEAAPAAKKSAAEKKKGKEKDSSAKAGADMIVGIVKAVIYMVVVLVISVFISIYVIRVGNDIFAFVKSDEVVDVVIPKDADIEDIAEILHENGVITFPGIFKMYADLKKDNGPFVEGTYSISPSMSYDDLRRAFKKQPVTGTVWITIPEGYTTDEIIDLLVENGIGKRKNYIKVINEYDFDYWFVDALDEAGISEDRAYRLDGYLFPDTYEFYLSSSEEVVIGRMLRRFNEVFVSDYQTRAEELGYTVDEILTIASLVEKEAGGLGDFKNVSAVFHNRLNRPADFPRLQSDATTVYAIQIATGKRPDTVTPEDNNFESAYNTYLNDGLPPGPITNPSASAMRYALYPAENEDIDDDGVAEVYYYFITDNTGKVHYAETIDEHNANIEIVRQINENLAG